jgi:hypothetical protein
LSPGQIPCSTGKYRDNCARQSVEIGFRAARSAVLSDRAKK